MGFDFHFNFLLNNNIVIYRYLFKLLKFLLFHVREQGAEFEIFGILIKINKINKN